MKEAGTNSAVILGDFNASRRGNNYQLRREFMTSYNFRRVHSKETFKRYGYTEWLLSLDILMFQPARITIEDFKVDCKRKVHGHASIHATVVLKPNGKDCSSASSDYEKVRIPQQVIEYSAAALDKENHRKNKKRNQEINKDKSGRTKLSIKEK